MSEAIPENVKQFLKNSKLREDQLNAEAVEILCSVSARDLWKMYDLIAKGAQLGQLLARFSKRSSVCVPKLMLPNINAMKENSTNGSQNVTARVKSVIESYNQLSTDRSYGPRVSGFRDSPVKSEFKPIHRAQTAAPTQVKEVSFKEPATTETKVNSEAELQQQLQKSQLQSQQQPKQQQQQQQQQEQQQQQQVDTKPEVQAHQAGNDKVPTDATQQKETEIQQTTQQAPPKQEFKRQSVELPELSFNDVNSVVNKFQQQNESPFTGKFFCDWLETNLDFCSSPDVSLAFAQMLFAHCFIESTSANFVGDANSFYSVHQGQQDECLNSLYMWRSDSRFACDVASTLLRRMLNLMEKHRCDIIAVKQDLEFRRLAVQTSELQRAQLDCLNDGEVLSFFTNVHNLLGLHAYIESGKKQSTAPHAQALHHFTSAKYNIAGDIYTLSEIEHSTFKLCSELEVGPGSHILSKLVSESKSGAHQTHLQLHMKEPRINFVLNWGSRLCPPIYVMPSNGQEIEQVLEMATRRYLDANVFVSEADNKVILPRILKWHIKDFQSGDKDKHKDLLKWVESKLCKSKRRFIEEMKQKLKQSNTLVEPKSPQASDGFKKKFSFFGRRESLTQSPSPQKSPRTAPEVNITFAKFDWGLGYSASKFGLVPRHYYAPMDQFFENLSVPLLCAFFEYLPLSDEVLYALAKLYSNRAREMLNYTSKREVASCDHYGTLFRRNSMYPRLVSVYCNIYGREFLKNSIGPLIKDICSEGIQLELNPDNCRDPNTDFAKNTATLLDLTANFLEKIVEYKDMIPPKLREAFSDLRRQVKEKFPDGDLQQTSSLVFLRFITPTIVAPDWMFDSRVEILPTPETRRTLTFIAKILQNLANKVEFGSKEKFMMPANSFITSKTAVGDAFVDEISTFSTSDNAKCNEPNISTAERNIYLACLHKYLFKNRDYIRKLEAKDEFKGEDGLEKLKHILDTMKDPVKIIDK